MSKDYRLKQTKKISELKKLTKEIKLPIITNTQRLSIKANEKEFPF
jgi:hypothetical protein